MELIVLTFFVSLSASVLSGMSGGGGAFILTPYYIFIGFTPQQAVATCKAAGLGIAGGTLTVFRGKGLIQKRLVLPLSILAICAGILATWFIPKIDAQTLQIIIGVLMLALVPTLFFNHGLLQPGRRTRDWVILGNVLYFAAAFGQALSGAGLAPLLAVVLILVFGLHALEASATNRIVLAAQSGLMLVIMSIQGYVVAAHAIATFGGSLLGSHIGGKLALKEGDRFVRIVLALTMGVSGLVLLHTAL